MFRRIEFKVLLLAALLILLMQAVVLAERFWGLDIRLASLLVILGGAYLRRGLNNHDLDVEAATLSDVKAKAYRNANFAVRLILFTAVVTTGLLMFQDLPRGLTAAGLDPLLAIFGALDVALIGAAVLCVRAAGLVEQPG